MVRDSAPVVQMWCGTRVKYRPRDHLPRLNSHFAGGGDRT
jgi:hypothetical protein